MADSRASEILRNYEFLWSEQANFRMLWNTIAQYVLPAWDNFVGYFSEGIIRTTRIFDATAITANERFASIMESLLTPRTQMWHDLVPADEDLRDNPEVASYCSTVRKIMFQARYRSGANYPSQTDECYLQLGAFGNMCMFVGEMLGKQILYRSVPLNEIVWALNAAGRVDTVYRKFRYSAKQIMECWPDTAPQAIRMAMDKTPYSEFDIIHAVMPNEMHRPGAMGPKGMPFASTYILMIERCVLEEGGYRSFPYAIGRYRMAPREHYGRSPGTVAFPAIRTLNEQKKTALRAGQKAVDPPLLLADEGALTPFNLRAGALNYGTLTSSGEALVQPLKAAGDFNIGKELMEMESLAINDAFLTTLMQILAQNPGMTAYEAALRAQEKGILIAPAMGRQQAEFIGPQIHRELDLLDHAGQLPPPPKILMQSMLKNGKGLEIEYTSPLSRLMRAEEATAIMQGVQGISEMSALHPELGDLINWDESGRDYLEAQGFPQKLINDPDKVAELRAAKAQQQQAQSVMAAAPGVSQAALNLAKAHQALGGSGAPPAAAGGGNAPAQGA